MDKPSIGDRQVLVRVRAAAVNPLDWHLVRGSPWLGRLMFGFSKPLNGRLGADLAGEVAEVGAGVTRFRPGDHVFGMVDGGGLGEPMLVPGSFAEYVAVPEKWLERIPENLCFEQAAAVPVAGITALRALQNRVQPATRVLINGASGGVGTFAVQIARAFGATVTGVCSTANLDLVRSIGADHAIDYTLEDFTLPAEPFYDFMLDNVTNRNLPECRRVLAPNGTYIANGGKGGPVLGPLPRVIRIMLYSPFVSQDMFSLLGKRTEEELPFLTLMLEAGQVTPVIDRTYPLDETPQALAYLEKGHARGKVVITV